MTGRNEKEMGVQCNLYTELEIIVLTSRRELEETPIFSSVLTHKYAITMTSL